MTDRREIIQKFYAAFQQLDYSSMNSCYTDDIVFSDPVFGLLRGDEVRSMWQMICKGAPDFSLKVSEAVWYDEEYASVQWTASYRYPPTGRRVVNRVKAFMRIRDGKISEHSDAFKISRWASQALGWKGMVFGWMGWMQRRIQKKARAALIHYIEQRSYH